MDNKQIALAEKLNSEVFKVVGNATDKLDGFKRAFMIASAVQELKTLLSPEFMKPILALQGNKLGFKTDKDNAGGYSEEIVKNCLIEAVLFGLEPAGNQFNIIKGNMYPTKEGLGHLLKKLPGLKYDIILDLPKINEKKDGAAVNAKICWSYNGSREEKEIPIPIKIDQYATVDSIHGKATRKARAWLFYTLTGSEIGDGETQDTEYKIVPPKPAPEIGRMSALIAQAKTLSDLDKLAPDIDNEQNLKEYEAKREELKAK